MCYLSVDVHTSQTARIIGNGISGRLFNRKQIHSSVRANNSPVCSGFDAGSFASAGVPHNISDLIGSRPPAFGTRHLLALDQNSELILLGGQRPVCFQLLAHCDIQLAARGIVG